MACDHCKFTHGVHKRDTVSVPFGAVFSVTPEHRDPGWSNPSSAGSLLAAQEMRSLLTAR